MPVLSAETLRTVGYRLFEAVGAPPEEAKLVADLMVDANLDGHDSHGVLRYPQYVETVRKGEITPGAEIETVRETPLVAVLNGNWGFGHVTAMRAMERAIEKASACGVGSVSVFNCNHVGRVGSYTRRAAEAGLIGIASVNGHGADQSVAPWAGIDRRMQTNPMSVAIPAGDAPIVLDMTTSVVALGKIRVKQNRGEPLPEGWIIDREGNPSTDPDAFFGPPPGAILPLGGVLGYKGFGLGVIVDILSGALSGAGCSSAHASRRGNGVFMLVLDIGCYRPAEAFREEVDRFVEYLKSSRRAEGMEEIMVPGEPERRERARRLREGVFVEDATWERIVECGKEVGVDVEGDLESSP